MSRRLDPLPKFPPEFPPLFLEAIMITTTIITIKTNIGKNPPSSDFSTRLPLYFPLKTSKIASVPLSKPL